MLSIQKGRSFTRYFDMRSDMNDLKKLVVQIIEKGKISTDIARENEGIIKKLYVTGDDQLSDAENLISNQKSARMERDDENIMDTEEIVEESLFLEDKEIELIIKALDKHNGKRKYAAQDLGISERTLYRKIKEYNIE
ncbi:MAG: hypothetical protein E4H16_05505 [Candidatus Atribacteria bacterium]|nr:MAG: hypothetical protein E4H16_05505 [Candidatus Atribacteria bacterium]